MKLQLFQAGYKILHPVEIKAYQKEFEGGNGGIFLHWFRLITLYFMFRFMLSNICYPNKNQKSFLK